MWRNFVINGSLTDRSRLFLDEIEHWLGTLPNLEIAQAASNPDGTAILVVDITNGFCNFGALASPRVKAIVPPIVELLQLGWSYGIKKFLLLQDTHDPSAEEFTAFPPHCVRGTPEAETVDEIRSLPFYPQMELIEKNSLSSDAHTQLGAWMQGNTGLDTFILAGDCTDLCVYQLAMFLKMEANALQVKRRVIVPANVVDTYDRPVSAARQQGGFPHEGDLMHAIFLYHMALNGIEVVQSIKPTVT
jgi:nicotinamidase-related amidase